MVLPELLKALDRSLFLLLNVSLTHPLADVVFIHGTEAFFWILPGIGAVVLFIMRKRQEALVVLGLGILTVAITDPLAARVLKPFFGRLRPCHPHYFIDGGRFLSGMKHSFSFPSVHATNVFAQATLLYFFYPKWKWVYLSFACFIGYSRIYVGVHYPLDVAAGAIVGIGVGCGIFFLYRLAADRFEWMKVQGIGKEAAADTRTDVQPESGGGVDDRNETL
jgi:undecaprenyl-diphosphatase